MNSQPIEVLRSVRQNLHDTIVGLPFDALADLPTKEGEKSKFVARCEVWHDNGVIAFNEAVASCYAPIDRAGTLPALSLIGIPKIGETGMEAPTPSYMMSYRNRIAAEDKRTETRLGVVGIRVPEDDARRLVLDLRLRSLLLVDWLAGAITRLETALWPRLTLDLDDIVTAEVAGTRVTRRKPLRPRAAEILRYLADKGKAKVSHRPELQRFREAVPELAPYLQAKKQTITIPDGLRRRITVVPPPD